jgi:hypothetical protein
MLQPRRRPAAELKDTMCDQKRTPADDTHHHHRHPTTKPTMCKPPQAPACGILCNPSSAKLNCGGGACPKVFGVGCAPKFDWKKKVFGH